ncbi:MAG: hypothetical protein AB7I42_19210 [Bradyrhizobium sp.]|uniref:hypothetical protein n=1 Tax=Bradyrhizobium sp. TaxID=376 RepID=UPI002A2B6403|nr:hypothetical protein [Bradyrhizobium sp.]
MVTALRQARRDGGSSLQIGISSAISPTFIARLIKGCRGDVSVQGLPFVKPEHFQRSNEHFSRPTPLAGGFALAQ